MYKNIGADTAGVALWEVVDENWPDETGQLQRSVICNTSAVS